MRRLRLSTLLIGINVGLLLFAVLGVAYSAVEFLEQLADDQALARVKQAGTSAQNAIARAGENLQTTTQLLAERPTLLRLLQTNDVAALTSFLTQFQQTGQLAGNAVLLEGQVVAQSGIALDWPTLGATPTAAPNYFFYAQPTGGPLVLGAWAAIPAVPNGVVLVALQLDATFAEHLTAEIGLPVLILAPQTLQAHPPLTSLREQVFNTGALVTTRLPDPERYVAIVPLRTPSSAVAGLVETTLSAADITRSRDELIRTLMLLAVAVTLLATLISLVVGSRLSVPLRALTNAAARIGRGDLTHPIPAAAGFEMGTLSATLEEMRRRLLQLTANLRRQQAEADAIVTGIVEGVFTVDRERRLQYLNPQALTLLGLTGEQALGRFCGDVLNPQGENGVRPCEENCPIIHARFRVGARATEHLLLGNGQRRTIVITSAPPAETDEGGLRQVQVLRDETEEEATRRMRDAVLANISHEFRTPLSAQLASIEMLLDQLPDLKTEQIAELVIALQRGTLRLTQLIDNLLESVRIEAGRFTIRQHPVALDEVIEQAVEMTRPLIVQRQQTVVVELPYPLPIIAGDAQRLTQVFVNLLANANKFSPTHSIIAIGGEVAVGHITLWVEDQGPGLPAAGAAVFVPFVRSLGEEPEAGGVGLGLWIVKSIVERHGGTVAVQSRAVGTRIAVTLPGQNPYEDSGRG